MFILTLNSDFIIYPFQHLIRIDPSIILPMNLELKKLGDIVENRVDHDRYNEIPGLEPASAAIRLNNRE